MLRRLVLDVIFPKMDGSIINLAEKLIKVSGVEAVNITVKEIDMETETLVVVVEGESIDYNSVKIVIEDLGGMIHSVDQVVAGRKVVQLPQEVIEEL